jgi:hypothetical protein
MSEYYLDIDLHKRRSYVVPMDAKGNGRWTRKVGHCLSTPQGKHLF